MSTKVKRDLIAFSSHITGICFNNGGTTLIKHYVLLGGCLEMVGINGVQMKPWDNPDCKHCNFVYRKEELGDCGLMHACSCDYVWKRLCGRQG